MGEIQVIEQVKNEIESLETDFTQLTMNHEAQVVFAQEANFAMQALQKNDYLMGVALKNKQSLRNAILNIAAVGLTLNPIEKQAYLIPRNKEVCLDISYMGLIDCATQEGALDMVKAMVVKDNDDFFYEGPVKEPTHKFDPFKDRGKIIGVYCVAKTPQGDFLTEVMNYEECIAIRDRSELWKRTKGGPWKDHEEEMLKKTVIRRASKTWPKARRGSRINQAVGVLNTHDGINFDEERAAAEEARKAEIQAAHDKQQLEKMEKEDLIKEILSLAGELTEGFSNDEKGIFMFEVMGIQKFSDIHKMTLAEIKELSDKLDKEKENPNNANAEPPME